MEILYPILIGVLVLLLLWMNSRHANHVAQPEYQLVQNEKALLTVELAKVQEREIMLNRLRTELQLALDKERQERAALERTLESTNAYLQAQQEKFVEQKVEIESIRQKFHLEFQHMANQILEEKSLKFTASNEKNISQILNPLREKIQHFEEKVDRSYQQESAERNVLKGVVEQLMQQSLQIKNEANNLTKALKGDTKKQGNWGEVILERVLERSGLLKDQEYRLQAAFQDHDTRKIPDAIIDLPDDKHIVIDSKVSLVAYERWVNAEEEFDLITFAKQHVHSLESHVRDLSAKNYQQLYQIQSPDFVLLFMPIESALSLAVKEKPELFSDAWDRKVVIVSPSTLLATLRTVASIWKQERQNRNVLEIAKEAGALYDKFVGFLQDMSQLENHLGKATEKHAEAMKKLASGAGNVVRKIENLKTLGAKATKQIDPKYLD